MLLVVIAVACVCCCLCLMQLSFVFDVAAVWDCCLYVLLLLFTGCCVLVVFVGGVACVCACGS